MLKCWEPETKDRPDFTYLVTFLEKFLNTFKAILDEPMDLESKAKATPNYENMKPESSSDLNYVITESEC